jgi:hypothetical protein
MHNPLMREGLEAFWVDQTDVFRDERCVRIHSGEHPEPEKQWQKALWAYGVLLAHRLGFEKSSPKMRASHPLLRSVTSLNIAD